MRKIETGNWRLRRVHRWFRKPVYVFELEFRNLEEDSPINGVGGLMLGTQWWWEEATPDHFGRNTIVHERTIIGRFQRMRMSYISRSYGDHK